MHMVIAASITGLALIYDTSGTISLVATALSVRGVTWIVKKITESINLDASQIIDFTGWSIAGVSMVKIISNAMGSVITVKLFFMNMSEYFLKIAEILDKITFWN